MAFEILIVLGGAVYGACAAYLVSALVQETLEDVRKTDSLGWTVTLYAATPIVLPIAAVWALLDTARQRFNKS